MFPRTEAPEVFRGFGTRVLEELHLDAPRRRAADGDVEKYHGVPSGDRLKRSEIVSVQRGCRMVVGGSWRKRGEAVVLCPNAFRICVGAERRAVYAILNAGFARKRD